MERREEMKEAHLEGDRTGKDEEEEQTGGGDEDEEQTGGGDEDAAGMKRKSADRKCVPGVLYLGHIPPRLRPKHLRNLLSVYGEIGRIFLQPEDSQVRRSKKKAGLSRCDFTEGWVEFRDKRVAKRVAASLHNTPMGTKKRQRFSSDLWCIKYLHRFQWTHLSEQLAYEQTVLQQRLRTEVSQAKKETNFYLNNVEKSAHLDKLKKKRQRDGEQVEEKTWDFTQRQTEEEIQKRRKKKKKEEDLVTQKHLDKARLIQQKSQSNASLLAKIFNSSQSERQQGGT
ncbi:activator of basal transcription 1 [Amphiprion ocellaris]|uniref:Activator of basal transcription 1 n=1 Tax=Amphiprion ocellaris TaxID=80972 RepID=A0A3Q1CMX2_AMPOC|nr:activator of basal transcription 1 [Amphiprion ocellaris]XP_054868755.1 activator of basal transcription 1 [Amphiprion ocellaris]